MLPKFFTYSYILGSFDQKITMQFISLFVFLCIFTQRVLTSGDTRCKCVCPKESRNQTNVFIMNDMINPYECVCENVVKREQLYCLKCECKFESRNSVLIKVIIIFVLSTIFVLYLYMFFVFIQSKHTSTGTLSPSDSFHEQLRDSAPSRRKMTLVNDIEKKISVWQMSIEEQRHHVYGGKKILY
uniref:Transmembrane protein 9B n=1 Tax=Hydra vulgaris TaxID=6087 RepID=T2M5H8_HYDVU